MATTASTSEPPFRFDGSQNPLVVELLPPLNHVQWAEIDSIGSEIIGRLETLKAPVLVVDLSGLKYMGSALVALVVRIWKSVKGTNGKMAVVNRDPMVLEVLQLSGLHQLWPIVEDRSQAAGVLKVRYPASTFIGSTGSIEAADDRFSLFEAGALLMTALSLLGLLQMWRPVQSIDLRVTLTIQYLGAAGGLILGTVCFLRNGRINRAVGAVCVLVCLAAILAGVLFVAPVR